MKKAKFKTKRAAAKRFKVTGTGKVMHRRQNTGCGHLRRKKSPKRRRQLRAWAEVSKVDEDRVKMMIPYK